MMKQSLFALLVLALFACDTTTQNADTTDADTTEVEVDTETQFGDAITAEGAQSVDELLANFPDADSVETKVYGKVTSVCQKKGCWMNVESADGEQEMFVRFKDYGFFMPLDLAGSEVIMEGKAFREVVSVDELRHYAEDEGKSAEEIAQITEPKEEYRFMASGVMIKN